MAVPSSSQTVGPFFSFALHHEHWNDLTAANPAGETIRIAGRVIDGDGAPVPDALVEIRQADAGGSYDDARFIGFGRCATDAEGRYSFTTIRPGRVPSALGLQAQHLAVQVFGRGLLRQLHTRMYFGDQPTENASDPLLMRVEDPARRETLIASRLPAANGVPEFHFDIVLQGKGETAFFEP